jgi:hypothetical protein
MSINVSQLSASLIAFLPFSDPEIGICSLMGIAGSTLEDLTESTKPHIKSPQKCPHLLKIWLGIVISLFINSYY